MHVVNNAAVDETFWQPEAIANRK